MTRSITKIKLTENKGFTLIELMIVIAIIGILAAVAIPNFIAYRDKAYCSTAEKDANSIAAALADYFAIPTHTTLKTILHLKDDPVAATGGFSGGPGLLVPGGLTTSPSFSPLSGENYAQIDGDIRALEIIVTDGSGRCPKDYMDAQAAAGWDSGTGKFTKTMK